MAQLQGAELALAAAMLAGAATAFVAPAPALLQVVGAPARVTLSGRPATGQLQTVDGPWLKAQKANTQTLNRILSL